jgi:hypothetical protein
MFRSYFPRGKDTILLAQEFGGSVDWYSGHMVLLAVWSPSQLAHFGVFLVPSWLWTMRNLFITIVNLGDFSLLMLKFK